MLLFHGPLKSFYNKNQSNLDINGLNLSPEKLEKVQTNLEEKARTSVVEIQGQYYETVD